MYKVIFDTVATKHYITEDKLPIYKEVGNTIGPYDTVAYGRVITPTKNDLLPLPRELMSNAKVAYSFSNLKISILISIEQLFDKECAAIFLQM